MCIPNTICNRYYKSLKTFVLHDLTKIFYKGNINNMF